MALDGQASMGKAREAKHWLRFAARRQRPGQEWQGRRARGVVSEGRCEGKEGFAMAKHWTARVQCLAAAETSAVAQGLWRGKLRQDVAKVRGSGVMAKHGDAMAKGSWAVGSERSTQ